MQETPADTHGDAHGESHLPVYKKVIVTLALLTALEFGIAMLIGVHAGAGFVIAVISLIALAAVKAVLVARFFMHVKYDPGIIAFLAILPPFLVSPLVFIAAFDLFHGPNLL